MKTLLLILISLSVTSCATTHHAWKVREGVSKANDAQVQKEFAECGMIQGDNQQVACLYSKGYSWEETE